LTARAHSEEYTPYGETSFGSFAFKRYRFTGKERDEESGLYYHGARYYAPWLMRWVSGDPIEFINLYSYAMCNPVKLVDTAGKSPKDPSAPPESGSYRTVRGDHIHQVASRTGSPGAKRETAPGFWDAKSISTKNPSYQDAAGQRVESAINRAAWGNDYAGKPAGPSGVVTVTATGSTAVGKTKAATPSPYYEDMKSLYKTYEGRVAPDTAGDLVLKSSHELEQAGAFPRRVPNAPVRTPTNLKQGQSLGPNTATPKESPNVLSTEAAELKGGVKALVPMVMTFIWDKFRESNAEQVARTLNKIDPSMNDVDFMESQGYTIWHWDAASGQTTWRYEPSWDRRVVEVFHELLTSEKTLQLLNQSSRIPDVT